MRWRPVLAAVASLALLGQGPATADQADSNPSEDKEGTTNREAPELPDTDTGDGFRVETSAQGDSIGVEIGAGGNGFGEGKRTGGAVSFTNTGATSPPCNHRAAVYGDYPTLVPPGNPVTIDPTAQLFSDTGPNPRLGWVRECAGTNSFYWTTLIDPVDLIPDALARARSTLPHPQPDINPSADAGGIVNVGMWLAIDDTGVTSARATLANAWAQVDARIRSITIDFGNGDQIECDGTGTPIPDWAWDELDEGPCGYTYRTSSPDDAPYTITITATHGVSWSTSDGRSGSLGTLSRSVTIDYDVDEIQTIGVRG